MTLTEKLIWYIVTKNCTNRNNTDFKVVTEQHYIKHRALLSPCVTGQIGTQEVGPRYYLI